MDVPLLDGLALELQFRGTPLSVSLEGHRLSVTAHAEGARPAIKVALGDDVHELHPGDRHIFTLPELR